MDDKRAVVVEDYLDEKGGTISPTPMVETQAKTVGVRVPDGCDDRKILKALLKLEKAPLPIPNSHAALLPLTPMEKGFALGLLAAVRRE